MNMSHEHRYNGSGKVSWRRRSKKVKLHNGGTYKLRTQPESFWQTTAATWSYLGMKALSSETVSSSPSSAWEVAIKHLQFGQPIDGASLWLWRSEIQYLLQQLTPDAEPVATHETHATDFDGEFATGWLDSSFRLARAGWWCKATWGTIRQPEVDVQMNTTTADYVRLRASVQSYERLQLDGVRWNPKMGSSLDFFSVCGLDSFSLPWALDSLFLLRGLDIDSMFSNMQMLCLPWSIENWKAAATFELQKIGLRREHSCACHVWNLQAMAMPLFSNMLTKTKTTKKNQEREPHRVGIWIFYKIP